jgi:hypothetical protein
MPFPPVGICLARAHTCLYATRSVAFEAQVIVFILGSQIHRRMLHFSNMTAIESRPAYGIKFQASIAAA